MHYKIHVSHSGNHKALTRSETPYKNNYQKKKNLVNLEGIFLRGDSSKSFIGEATKILNRAYNNNNF